MPIKIVKTMGKEWFAVHYQMNLLLTELTNRAVFKILTFEHPNVSSFLKIPSRLIR